MWSVFLSSQQSVVRIHQPWLTFTMHFLDNVNALFTSKYAKNQDGNWSVPYGLLWTKIQIQSTQNGTWEDAETTFQIHELVILVLNSVYIPYKGREFYAITLMQLCVCMQLPNRLYDIYCKIINFCGMKLKQITKKKCFGSWKKKKIIWWIRAPFHKTCYQK